MRFTDCHENPAPVGVTTVNSSFDQKRRCTLPRSHQCVIVGVCTLDSDLDQLGGALAVAGDLDCQVAAYLQHSLGKRLGCLVASREDLTASRTVCQQQHCVVRALIAIDVDLVEGQLHRSRKCFLQENRLHVRIGGSKGKHCRHVRVNHSRALRYAADSMGHSVDIERDCDLFRAFVGSQNCPRVFIATVFGNFDLRDVLTHERHRNFYADDASRCDQRLFGCDTEPGRRKIGHFSGVDQALPAHGGVRAAAVGDYCSHLFIHPNALSRESDRRRDHAILRESSSDSARLV